LSCPGGSSPRSPRGCWRARCARQRCTELQRELLGRDPAAPLPSQTWPSWREEMKEFYAIFES
jgi:hypothetical protein